MKNVCIGAGYVGLDIIYKNNEPRPYFLAGGSCGNVLVNLSYLGWSSNPIARLGTDIEGDRIIEDMKRWGVKTKFVKRESQIQTPKVIERIPSRRKPRHRFYLTCDHGNWLPTVGPYTLKALGQIQDKLPESNVFYFDRASPSALQLAKTLKAKNNTLIYFEPAKFLDDRVFQECLETADIVKYCQRQLKKEDIGVRVPLEIQTKGEEGLRYLLLRQKTWHEMDAFPITNLVDAAGSGDWMSAGIIHSIGRDISGTTNSFFPLSQKRLETALKFSQALSALNCNFLGARGMMYHLTKSEIFSLVKKTIAADRSPEIGIIASQSQAKRNQTSSLSLKCKVCLCSD